MTLHDALLASAPAAVTALFGYLAARIQFRQKPAEVSDQIAAAFTRLVDQLQEENTRHLASIKVLNEDAHRNRSAIMKFKAFGQACLAHIHTLEQQIIALGAVPAVRPTLPDPG